LDGAWRSLLTPIWRRGSRKGTAILLLLLWSFLACFRVTFAFTFTMYYGNRFMCHSFIQ